MTTKCDCATCQDRTGPETNAVFTGKFRDQHGDLHEVSLCRYHNEFNNPLRLANGDSVNPGKGTYIKR